MTVHADDILDLVAGTLKELGRLRFEQIAQALVDYEVMGRILKKDKIGFEGGIGISRNLMVTTSGAAKHVKLFDKDTVAIADVLKTITLPWRHTTTNYAYERRELAMNSGSAEKVVDIIKVRRTDGLLSLVEKMEEAFWNKPTDSTDDTKPFGVPYWIVKNASAGFNGGAPSGFPAGAGGLLHANWKNYTGTYTNVTKDDVITKLRTAFRKIGFKSPVNVQDYRTGKGERYRLYVTETTINALELLGEAQNENLGRDLASMDDQITFKRCPIIWVPYLDSDTQLPIYMIDFDSFQPVFLTGEFLREQGPHLAPEQHATYVVFIDTSWNVLCVDRRRQCVLYKP